MPNKRPILGRIRRAFRKKSLSLEIRSRLATARLAEEHAVNCFWKIKTLLLENKLPLAGRAELLGGVFWDKILIPPHQPKYMPTKNIEQTISLLKELKRANQFLQRLSRHAKKHWLKAPKHQEFLAGRLRNGSFVLTKFERTRNTENVPQNKINELISLFLAELAARKNIGK